MHHSNVQSGRQDSNLREHDPKPCARPLGYTLIDCLLVPALPQLRREGRKDFRLLKDLGDTFIVVLLPNDSLLLSLAEIFLRQGLRGKARNYVIGSVRHGTV